MADIINLLADASEDVAQLRERRPEAKENAQASSPRSLSLKSPARSAMRSATPSRRLLLAFTRLRRRWSSIPTCWRRNPRSSPQK